MVGIIGSEVYSSIFNLTEENNSFNFSKFLDEKCGGVSYENVRDEIEIDLEISDIRTTHLQDDITGPNFIEEYREQVSKRMKNDEYKRILAVYKSSIFQDFENFPRREIDLVEDDIRLVLDENKSTSIFFELEPGIYTFKDLSEALFNNLQPEEELFNNSVDIEFDDIFMKTKLVVRSGIIATIFDENRLLILSQVSLHIGIGNTMKNTLARKL